MPGEPVIHKLAARETIRCNEKGCFTPSAAFRTGTRKPGGVGLEKVSQAVAVLGTHGTSTRGQTDI